MATSQTFSLNNYEYNAAAGIMLIDWSDRGGGEHPEPGPGGSIRLRMR